MKLIELKDVVLDYPILDVNRSFRSHFLRKYSGGKILKNEKSKRVVVRALDGISFSLSKGDRIGIVGPNGAGKSTLLSVIAGIFEPNSGYVRIRGSVSTLFNTTLGMDSDDTGIENIQNISAYLGMPPQEVSSKIDEIVDFCDLGDFINLPIRTYSEGMKMRLAFAIATSIHPNILVLDEGLGAGDASFTIRAKNRVNDLVERANVMILASHSDELIKTMCNKAIYLQGGRIKATGTVDNVLEAYKTDSGA